MSSGSYAGKKAAAPEIRSPWPPAGASERLASAAEIAAGSGPVPAHRAEQLLGDIARLLYDELGYPVTVNPECRDLALFSAAGILHAFGVRAVVPAEDMARAAELARDIKLEEDAGARAPGQLLV